jgi:peptidoglycan/LPS O-acetylase OafA/YrhL
MDSRRRIGLSLGAAGAALGVLAGIVQWAAGDEIPDWTGNKLHPVQLGIITILLSLLALGSVVVASRDPEGPAWRRVLLWLGILVPAGICFTTVGRLWFLPGPLLIVAAVLLLRPGPMAR